MRQSLSEKTNTRQSLWEIFSKYIPDSSLDTYKRIYSNNTMPDSCDVSVYTWAEWNTLMYIWDRHAAHFDDKDYFFIKQEFEKFNELSNWKPKIGLIEGWVDWKVPEKEEDLLHWKEISTPSYVKFLCSQADIECTSPELWHHKEQEYLLEAWYSRKEIAVYNILRFLWTAIWIQHKQLNKDLLLSYFPDEESVHKNVQYFFDETWLNLYELNIDIIRSFVDPTWDFSKFNKARRIIWFMREKAILDSISHYFEQWYNVFIVYGHWHRQLHKPILDEYIWHQNW